MICAILRPAARHRDRGLARVRRYRWEDRGVVGQGAMVGGHDHGVLEPTGCCGQDTAATGLRERDPYDTETSPRPPGRVRHHGERVRRLERDASPCREPGAGRVPGSL